MELFFSAVFYAAIILGAFYLFTLPIEIGEAKGLPRSKMRPIRILNWCSLFCGVTWIIALYLAVTAPSTPLRRRRK
ncbi:MAG: hypothetical protein IKJ34_01500 [Mailhella sp.]|nr:hypothetical protein [Mailhella sp.]